MVSARSAVRPGRMPQRWPQPGATTGRSWHSGRQPDCRARHPDWHIRLLRDRAGGLAKRLKHLAQGPHAGRGSTALPRSAAHGCLGLPKAQPPPRPPVSRTVVSSQSGVRQGGPLGQLLFALTLQGPLEEVAAKGQQLRAWTAGLSSST
jgi:hypothetical protein